MPHACHSHNSHKKEDITLIAREEPWSPLDSSSRRRFLGQLAALAATPSLLRTANAARVNPPAMLEIEQGHYRVLPAGGVFCGGVLPAEGYEVIHVILRPNLPLLQGYTFVEGYLKNLDLPVQAVCGMELRVPAQMTLDAFRTFNGPYVEQLRKWDLMVGNYSAVCRTNVAPGLDAPTQASLHAFIYVAPAGRKGSTFCVSGTADIDPKGKVVAERDTSAAGMTEKLKYVIDVIGGRLAELELSWDDATQVDLYMVEEMRNLWGTTVLPALGAAASAGVRLHYARPPIHGAEVELEVRGVMQEITART
jgi:hypothetical protein